MKPSWNTNINKNYICCIKIRQEVGLNSYQIFKAHCFKKNSRKRMVQIFVRKQRSALSGSLDGIIHQQCSSSVREANAYKSRFHL